MVIYEALPNELPRVAGIISAVPQTPLSHVNLRAIQEGVPNAFIAGALEDDSISDLVGGYVYYAVTPSGYTIRAATQEEVDAHYAASRPAETQTPERDLSVTDITALSEVGFDDWDSFGVKAANVAVLGTLGFPDGTVPDGFAIPFYFYDEFMKHNDLYDDIEEMLADTDFQTDYDTKVDELKKLRKEIKKADTPEWIETALTEMHATYSEGQSLRYRSSTNNEDLPGFNGAGLYDSKTQHPEETEEDGISKSLKQVYAGLWNFRAFIERDFHRIDHLAAAMGVLVHPNYSDELVNGVAVSTDPAYGTDGTYYVNSQVGEDLVTNPELNSVPEETLLNSDGAYTVVSLSNQARPGQLLMTGEQMAQLRRHLAAIHEKFEESYGTQDGEPFAMEIEFKITSDNVLAIKQARPWVFADPPPEIEVDSGVVAGPPLTASLVGVPSIHDGRIFSFKVQFSEGISSRAHEFMRHAFAVTGGTVTSSRRVQRRDDLWRVNVTPDSASRNVTVILAADRYCLVVGAVCTVDGRRLSTRLRHTVAASVNTSFGGLLTGVPVWSGMVRLEWRALPRGVSYEVQYLQNSHWIDLPSDGTSIAFFGGGAVVKNLLLKDTRFRVRSVNYQGTSEWSESLFINSTGGPGHWTDVPEPVNSPATGLPAVSGTARVGETLTADTSGIADGNGLNRVRFRYQWVSSDETTDSDIEGATSQNYRLTRNETGKSIKVRVSYTDRHGFAESLTSAPTGAAAEFQNTPATGAPTISGTVQVRKTLKANTSAIADEDGLDNAVFTYQWKAGGADIPDATGSTYTPTGGDLGKSIRVRVSFTDDWGSDETLTSQPTGTVQASPPETPDTPTGRALWSGMVTLEWGDVPGADSYQVQHFQTSGWFVLPHGETTIAFYGAGAVIKNLPLYGTSFRIRAVNAHGASEWPEYLFLGTTGGPGHWTDVPEPVNSPATGLPAISGTARVGETLTADRSGIADGNGLDRVRFRYQWVSNDGTADSDIEGATGETYTLTTADDGRTIRVRVSFVDRHGFSESLTSAATATVAPQPDWEATLTPGESNVTIPPRSGYSVHGNMGGALTPASFEVDGTFYQVSFLVHDASGLYLGLGTAPSKDFLLKVGEAEYVGSESSIAPTGARVAYYWPTPASGWTVGQPVAMRLTFKAEALPSELEAAPLLAYFQNVPETHDGSSDLTFRLYFSEGTITTVAALTTLLEVSGGELVEVVGVGSAAGTEGRIWKLKMRPGSREDVTVVMPAETSCDNPGAVCTGDGRMLSNRVEATIQGPADVNTPAAGAPTITGTAQVGEALTASSTGIADADGLTNVSYSYRWLADDAEIAGAIGSSYTLTDDDQGKAVRVRVSFTDDAGNAESLTSAATATVAARPNTPATGTPTIHGTAQVGGTLTTSTSGITDQDGLTNVSYSYQWLADGAEIAGATGSSYTLTDSEEGKTVKVRVSFTDDAGHDESLTSTATGAVAASEPTSPPPAPANLTAEVTEDGHIRLSWTAPDDDSVTGYQVLRRRPEEGEGTLEIYVPNTGSTETAWTDTDAPAGTVYVYRVKAINAAGVGPRSNYVRVDHES